MAYSRTEYNATVSISRANVTDMYKAQKAALDFWEGKISQAQLKSTLAGLAATALELIFKKSAYSAIAGYLVSALSGASAYEKSEVKAALTEGKNELADLMQLFIDHKNYTSVTARVNYLKFTNLSTGVVDFNVVQGNIILTKILTTGGGSIIL